MRDTLTRPPGTGCGPAPALARNVELRHDADHRAGRGPGDFVSSQQEGDDPNLERAGEVLRRATLRRDRIGAAPAGREPVRVGIQLRTVRVWRDDSTEFSGALRAELHRDGGDADADRDHEYRGPGRGGDPDYADR